MSDDSVFLTPDQDLDAPDELETAVAGLQSTVGALVQRIEVLEGKAGVKGVTRLETSTEPVFLSEGARSDAEVLANAEEHAGDSAGDGDVLDEDDETDAEDVPADDIDEAALAAEAQEKIDAAEEDQPK